MQVWAYGRLYLFPTWVGVILTMEFSFERDATFPHMGGGDPGAQKKLGKSRCFSPHGWG